MKRLLLLIFIILIVSCQKEPNEFSLNTLSEGAVNMIKVLNGEVFVLNATRSSIQKIDGDSLKTIVDIQIDGRDFLLDFAKKGKEFYVSNTYDEIFRTVNGKIIDTIKVANPDKIAFSGDKLYVTNRFNRQEENDDLKINCFDTVDKSLKLYQIDKEVISGISFGQAAIYTSGIKIYIYDPTVNSIRIFDNDLNESEEIDLPKVLSYGNMFVENDIIYMLANENDKLMVLELKDQKIKNTATNIDISSIDLRSSAIDKNRVYLYDYILGKIEIKRWYYEE